MFWWFKPPQAAQRRAALRQAQQSELAEDGSYHEAQDIPVVDSANVNRPITKEPLPAKPPNDPTDDEDLEFLKGIGREAQVWKTYVEETKDFDDDMVDGWNRFVLESAKKLEPDKADQTVAILREISQTLQANGAQTQIAGRSGFAVNDESFQPTTSAVWINCLWFLSLSLSIAVSLAAMLAKQWCYYYVSARNGDTITQAEERQQRFSGLSSWRMRGILEHLPMLMHISLGLWLALFSAGLVLYLWDINVAVATTVSIVSVSALCFYLGTISVPLWDKFCPYKTTQSVYLRIMLVAIVRKLPPSFFPKESASFRSIFSRFVGWFFHQNSRLFRSTQPGSSVPAPDHVQIEANIETPAHILDMRPESVSSPKAMSSEPDSMPLDEEDQPFVKDALAWLVCNSQKSSSIDTAIGALAIGKVKIQPSDPLKQQIHLHLVKHFSDCFTSDKDKVTLQLSHRHNALQCARDYVNWMVYFAGGTHEDVEQQLEQFIENKNPELELVIRFGLGLASLAEQSGLSPETSRNVVIWISAFIRRYDKERLYLSEDILSALIDGLTLAGRNAYIDIDQERAQRLAVPQLINILWKVSHLDDSKLRASIGANLAMVAMTTKGLAYPISDSQSFNSAAGSLASDVRSSSKRNSENFVSLVVFALLGFIHPRSKLEMDDKAQETAVYIIHETRYLSYRGTSMNIPRLADLDPLRRHLTSMLIECMVQPGSDNLTEQGWYLLEAAFEDRRGFSNEKLPSVTHAICSFIQAHLQRRATLYPDALRAATDLLFKEVRKLPRLDSTILGLEPHDTELDDQSPSRRPGLQASHDSLNNMTAETEEHIASSTLALIMAKSDDKQCLETAVQAVLFHTRHECSADLVIRAAKWFTTGFGAAENMNKEELLHMCGYVRILTSMVLHCTESDILAENLRTSSNQLHKSIAAKIELLSATHNEEHIRAFGVAGLAVWSSGSSTNPDDMKDTDTMLSNAWKLIIEHAELSYPQTESSEPPMMRADGSNLALRSEAIEALLDATALLSVLVRPALAVALAFWGLSLDKWDFWTPEMRQQCWRDYTQTKTRNKNAAALFLLGLSRLLAHYNNLKLDHASIRTIALEIHHYMQEHASHPSTLTLTFLSGYDVRRHVRESVWQYLQATESDGPFTTSAATSRNRLRLAVQYDGGEGFMYEEPQPFARLPRPSIHNAAGREQGSFLSGGLGYGTYEASLASPLPTPGLN
ncbi:hypothetical protein FRC09_000172 [Ceratobasidium sp. 395]|nr:hypothetical protein FRC09_000172 [Ceratobasidium sp. 395]